MRLQLSECRFGFEYADGSFTPFEPSLQVTEELLLELWSDQWYQSHGWLIYSFGVKVFGDHQGASFVRLFNPFSGEKKQLGNAYHYNQLLLKRLREIAGESRG